MKQKISLLFLFLTASTSTLLAQEEYVQKEPQKTSNFHFRILQDQGVTFNLAESQKAKNFKQLNSANFHFGVNALVEYKNYFVSLGSYFHSYTVSVKTRDEAAVTSHKSASTSEFYRYTQIPIRAGMFFETRKNWLSIAPYLAENILSTKHAGISFTSTGYGLSISEGDSIFDSLAVSMARPYSKIFAPGAGILICAGKKYVRVALQAEYYQGNKTWTAIRSYYSRYSKKLGHYERTDFYNSKAQTINLSLSLQFRF